MRRALPLLLLATVACGHADGTAAPVASPCVSPYAGTDAEPLAAFPDAGERVQIGLRVGDHLTVGWRECGTSGAITSTDPTGQLLSATDIGSASRGGPTIEVRYLAVAAGEVSLSGEGAGSIAVTIR